MNAIIRQKIARVLANAETRPSELPQPDASLAAPVTTASEIADHILAGEKTYRIKQVQTMTGYAYTTIKRHLRGRPGWLRNPGSGPGGGIRITESLLKSYLKDQAAKGLKDVA